VEGGGGEAALAKIVSGLEILLDALVAARQHDNRALMRPLGRAKAGVADLLAVGRREEAAGRLVGDRIAGNLVKNAVVHAMIRAAAAVHGDRKPIVEMQRF